MTTLSLHIHNDAQNTQKQTPCENEMKTTHDYYINNDAKTNKQKQNKNNTM